MSKNPNYLTNKEILPEIINFRKTGIASEKFGEICLKMAKNIAKKSNFAGYTKDWKEDMISDAVITCIKYSKNFDPEKSQNPFSYLSSICHNAFKAYLNSQKIHKEIKDECYKKQDFISKDPYSAIDYKDLKKWDTVVNSI